MKHTRSLVARVALTAALSIAAASAHAIPIVFDFTGTVTSSFTVEHGVGGIITNDALIGQAVSGRITLETDGLTAFSRTQPSGLTMGLGDGPNEPAVQITSQLIIAGQSYDVATYAGKGGQIEAFDSSGVPGCAGCSTAYDYLRLSQSSAEFWNSVTQPKPDEYHIRSLRLDWMDLTNRLGLIDLSNGFDPLELLPMMSSIVPTGRFDDLTNRCVDGLCGQAGVDALTAFSIDSMTVSVASVPEPETLALFAIGLLGTGLARRARRR